MSTVPKWARIAPDDFQQRIRALETVYTQKELSEKLGISRRSLNYYQKGASFPKKQSVYNTVNQLYNKEKKRIEPEKVKKRTEKQKTASDAQKYGRIKWRTVPIYPDYMYNSPASQFEGISKWDRLEELGENGYVAGWRGRNEIPLEVQFVIHGEGEKRFGSVLQVVMVATRITSPKLENGFTGQDTTLEEHSVWVGLLKLRKEDNFLERLDKVRTYMMTLETDKGYPLSLLGYYFKEGDEK